MHTEPDSALTRSAYIEEVQDPQTMNPGGDVPSLKYGKLTPSGDLNVTNQEVSQKILVTKANSAYRDVHCLYYGYSHKVDG